MKFKNKKVLVYGLGDSGRSAVKLLSRINAHVYFYDDDVSYSNFIGYVRRIENEKFDYCVVSPGVKMKDNPYIEIMKNKGTIILSELDLGYLFLKGKIIAVTGTNGKTTTCNLIYKILKDNGYDARLCGNIGVPITSINDTTKNSVTVVEVSSFQLESSRLFRCDIGVILNVMPDHLDRHGTMQEYINCKKKLASFTKRKLVLNLDDEIAKTFNFDKKCLYFSKKTLKKGVFAKNNQIFINKKPVCGVQNIKLKGEKNLENVLASVASLSNFKGMNFHDSISSFLPSAHRLELVGECKGVMYVDDSKATNVASVINALTAFDGKRILLLLGGQGKNAPYDSIFQHPLKEVVTFGEEGEKISAIANRYKVPTANFKHFDDAVFYACERGEVGDVVLLSPACSSFDEFSSYKERGEKFKELVLEFLSGKD